MIPKKENSPSTWEEGLEVLEAQSQEELSQALAQNQPVVGVWKEKDSWRLYAGYGPWDIINTTESQLRALRELLNKLFSN